MGWCGRRARRSRGLLLLLAIDAAVELALAKGRTPVTAGLVLVNTLIHLRPGALHRITPTLREARFNPYLIVKYRDLKRFFISPFYHVEDGHLVCNMMAVLEAGIRLETSMGSVEYASMVATLLCLSEGITLVLARSLYLFCDDEAAYHTSAVGFSSVLFAMSVVRGAQPNKYAGFYRLLIAAELILTPLFVRRIYYLGHLGGFLAGYLYLWLRGSCPLAALIRDAAGIVSRPLRYLFWLQRHRGLGLGMGPAGGMQPGSGTSRVWRCPAFTYVSSVWENLCESCRKEGRHNASLPEGTCSTEHGRGVFSSTPPSHQTVELNKEEVCRRWPERMKQLFGTLYYTDRFWITNLVACPLMCLVLL